MLDINKSDIPCFYFGQSSVALYALLKAFGLGVNDRVLIPGNSGMDSRLAISYAGAIPEYVDIDPQSYHSLLSHYIEKHKYLVNKCLGHP